MALIAREGGCSFPGCDHPPQWCDRHHILDWIDGGPADLDNLTLLCRYHHTHFLQKGWSCRINGDRLPEWIPPRWIDAEQRPQLNGRIRRLNAQQELGRRRRAPAAA
jgi:HNH endonuclease